MRIKHTHDYFWRQRELHPERKEISVGHCQYVLDHRNEGLFYEQPDGKLRCTARRSGDLGLLDSHAI